MTDFVDDTGYPEDYENSPYKNITYKELKSSLDIIETSRKEIAENFQVMSEGTPEEKQVYEFVMQSMATIRNMMEELTTHALIEEIADERIIALNKELGC